MRRKIQLLIILILALPFSVLVQGTARTEVAQQSSYTAGEACLVVWLRSGEKVVYELAESPVTKFTGWQLVISTNNVTVPYDRSSVLRYTYEGVVYQGIDLQPGERRVQVSHDASSVTFRGLQDGAPVSVYAVNGTLLEQLKATGGQPMTVSLQNRPTGVYIIKAGTETIKLTRP